MDPHHYRAGIIGAHVQQFSARYGCHIDDFGSSRSGRKQHCNSERRTSNSIFHDLVSPD
jgi:hypothetical protein